MMETIVKETEFLEEEVNLEYDKFAERFPGLEVSKTAFLGANKERQ